MPIGFTVNCFYQPLLIAEGVIRINKMAYFIPAKPGGACISNFFNIRLIRRNFGFLKQYQVYIYD
jgi:hypothetical protein